MRRAAWVVLALSVSPLCAYVAYGYLSYAAMRRDLADARFQSDQCSMAVVTAHAVAELALRKAEQIEAHNQRLIAAFKLPTPVPQPRRRGA